MTDKTPSSETASSGQSLASESTLTVEQRVLDSFQGDGSEIKAKEYSENVYAAWKDISGSLGRSALLAYLLMAIFELLVYQHSSTVISIGTFTLVNAPIVQIVLPAIVAFILYDGYRLSVRWLNLQGVYYTLTGIWAPKLGDNGLDVLVSPSLPSLWALGRVGPIYIATTAGRFMFIVNRIVSYSMMFAVPVAFECQAYDRLFQKLGYHNVLLWISLVIAGLLIVCSAVYVWLVNYGT